MKGEFSHMKGETSHVRLKTTCETIVALHIYHSLTWVQYHPSLKLLLYKFLARFIVLCMHKSEFTITIYNA